MTMSVIVTGASSGLGMVAAGELARAGHHVILGCRSVQRGRAAAATILTATPGASVETVELDLASLASVRAAARDLVAGSAHRPPLRAVVCNAGIQVVDGVQRSADGYELTFATNHLGHFLLVQLLLEQVAEPARVVFVSSGTHFGPPRSIGFPAPHWADPEVLADADAAALDASPRAGRVRYATSKLANIYCTYELARRLTGRDVTANAFDPGLMPETRLDRDYPPRVQRLYDRLTPLLVRLVPGARPVARSGADLAWLATAPELAVVTGAYFVGRRRRRTSGESYDRGRAAALWTASERLVQATDELPHHSGA
jgi:protochlorophyllide reductase